MAFNTSGDFGIVHPMILVLTGLKHTGKSTIGAQVARKLNARFTDTDALIAERCGKTPRELFDEGGSALMASEETRACEWLASECAKDPHAAWVIATGGALAENQKAFDCLKKIGTIVYIDTPFEILFDRVQKSAERDGRWPKFLQNGDPREKFRDIFVKRSEIYARMADITLLAGRKPPQAIIRELLDRASS